MTSPSLTDRIELMSSPSLTDKIELEEPVSTPHSQDQHAAASSTPHQGADGIESHGGKNPIYALFGVEGIDDGLYSGWENVVQLLSRSGTGMYSLTGNDWAHAIEEFTRMKAQRDTERVESAAAADVTQSRHVLPFIEAGVGLQDMGKMWYYPISNPFKLHHDYFSALRASQHENRCDVRIFHSFRDAMESMDSDRMAVYKPRQ